MPTAQLPGVGELLEAAVTAVGGTRREGQDTMAQAVRSAIATGEHVAVQAGTGTGKSLAYLVPAIHHAVEKNSTVVISTATIALQRQLVDRDLPRVAKALKPLLGRTPTFAILKGRRNYLCLNKLHGGDENPEDELFDPFQISAMGRAVKRIHEWADDTETGDRDELVPGVPDSHVAAWCRSPRASASARPSAPSATSASRSAPARRPGGPTSSSPTTRCWPSTPWTGGAVLPEHDVVVVDEAHELVDRVTGVATGELSAGVVAAVARRLGRLIDQSIADRLAEAGEGLGLVLEDLRPGRWEALPQPASGALSAVLDAAAAVPHGAGRRAPGGAGRRRQPQDRAGRAGGGARHHRPAAQGVRRAGSGEALRRRVAGRGGRRSAQGAPRRPAVGRRAAARAAVRAFHGGAHVGHAGARRQLRRAGPAVGAPAGGGATTDDPVPDPEAPKWSGLDVGSPFAHAKSGILYVAKSLPPPGRDGLPPAYLDEIAGLVEAAGGRTLGLFSSMRAAKQATEALRDRLATPLLCQGDDATMLLVKRFAEDDETSLFGTLSLWQGVDVPGPSLSCVIIDRIPFPRPDDPLVSARQRAADSRGGNGFLQVSATHAALLLAQGAGRLLRGMDDRGVVAILDPRLATARYGGFLRASLPPFWPTDDRAKVHAALRRLRGA